MLGNGKRIRAVRLERQAGLGLDAGRRRRGGSGTAALRSAHEPPHAARPGRAVEPDGRDDEADRPAGFQPRGLPRGHDPDDAGEHAVRRAGRLVRPRRRRRRRSRWFATPAAGEHPNLLENEAPRPDSLAPRGAGAIGLVQGHELDGQGHGGHAAELRHVRAHGDVTDPRPEDPCAGRQAARARRQARAVWPRRSTSSSPRRAARRSTARSGSRAR